MRTIAYSQNPKFFKRSIPYQTSIGVGIAREGGWDEGTRFASGDI